MISKSPSWESFTEEKLTEIAKEGTVLDIGGGEPFQKWLAPYKSLFKNARYLTMEPDTSLKPDIVGDIHAIPIPTGTIDAIICHSVLEHVENPIKAVEEMHRILRSGGKIFVQIPSIYPYHARKGAYKDYWRFFDDTIVMLFAQFASLEVSKRGGYFKALLFFFPFQHKLRFIIDPLARLLDTLFRTDRRTTTAGYYIYAVKK